jgi:hypothetical protein
MERQNVKNDFANWFHPKAPIAYKRWYGTNLIKKLDDIERTYYESFNEKLFEISLDDIQNKINVIKDNLNNRYSVSDTSFAEYDTKCRNGVPKSILKNHYIKYLLEIYGGIETIDATEKGLHEKSNKNALENILVKDLETIESGLKLYELDRINGIKYSAGGKFIDILAMDKDNNYVVIEISNGKSYENMAGEILRNKAWIQKNMAKEGQRVRGMIISNEITEDLIMACMNLTDMELYEYELCIKIKKK